MLQLINRKHPDIVGRTNGKCAVSLSDNYMTFTKTAVKEFGLEVGKYVHFNNIGDEWHFIVNDDPDGFKLNSSGSRNGAKIYCAPLMRLIVKTIKYKLPVAFYLQKSSNTIQGKPVIEILTHKPTSMVGK